MSPRGWWRWQSGMRITRRLKPDKTEEQQAEEEMVGRKEKDIRKAGSSDASRRLTKFSVRVPGTILFLDQHLYQLSFPSTVLSKSLFCHFFEYKYILSFWLKCFVVLLFVNQRKFYLFNIFVLLFRNSSDSWHLKQSKILEMVRNCTIKSHYRLEMLFSLWICCFHLEEHF